MTYRVDDVYAEIFNDQITLHIGPGSVSFNTKDANALARLIRQMKQDDVV